MRLHHIFFITLLLLIIISLKSSFADYVHNSETSREAIVNSTRTKRFTDSDKMNNSFFALGGSYDNDQNSRQYQITSRYFQQSYRFINEINFLHETEFNDRGSGSKNNIRPKHQNYTIFRFLVRLEPLIQEIMWFYIIVQLRINLLIMAEIQEMPLVLGVCFLMIV